MLSPNSRNSNNADHISPSQHIGVVSHPARRFSGPAPGQASSHSNGAGHVLLRQYEQELDCKADGIELLSCRNSQLLRAYKQSQNRCATLETQLGLLESQVDHLRNDRISLEARVNTFRETNDTLKKSCDDAWSQSCTLSSQYLKMMSLALSLGKQNIDKEQLWVAKEEEWERTHSKLALQLERRECEARRCSCPRAQYLSADIYSSERETEKSNAVLPYLAPSTSQEYSASASIPDSIFSAQSANDDSESMPVESSSCGARTSSSSLYSQGQT